MTKEGLAVGATSLVADMGKEKFEETGKNRQKQT
jgi:hypothetical protein